MAEPVTNALLNALPAAERSRLLKLLEPVALPVRTELYGTGQSPRYVHFLTSGMASTVTEMSGGVGVEVGLAARECLAESLFLLGPLTGQARCFMQVEGTGLRMSFARFREEFLQSPVLRDLVLQHVQYGSIVMSQLAACNRLHGAEKRLARWLLMVAARLGSRELDLTQEFLGAMLGSRRATVTLSAGTLQRAGLIEYRRGHICILNHEGLEDTACECYRLTQRLLDTLYTT